MRLPTPLGLALSILSACPVLAGDEAPRHNLPIPQAGNRVVGLCDGETSIEVPGVKPGDSMTREEAQRVADALMQKWRGKHPNAEWVVAQSMTLPSPQSEGRATAPATPPKSQFQTYGAFTDRDRQIWQESTDKLVAEGKRIFHDAKALGGTHAISCDMCHPDGANTHPETYPKYQVQLGRVALLRDMINWCIENPIRGKPFADDDPRLKALEAYILAQRKGVPLDYGKH
ncbi:MAG: c-type cytochrome [Methylocystis sp.]|uniref:c-type cytochrome n=1 Tax=Methylocystis sp. TaxID=1911079 RepID=UPI003DA5DCE9